MKNRFVLVLCIIIVCLFVSSAFAEGIEERVMRQWSRTEKHSRGDQTVDLKVTYYSAEYVEALVQSEAEKNMWTNDELERYKYNLLRTLNLDENIAFHVDIDVLGSPLYLNPMDRFFRLRIGGKIYDAVDYDKRFNFRLSGRRDGLIWFRRYDEKTGSDLLEKVKDIRMVILSHFSMATAGRGDLMLIWDITKDNPAALYKGRAADRLELDRLIKRMEKLVSDRKELNSQLQKVNDEIASINARIEELQR